MIVVCSSYNIYIFITKACKEILQERLSLQGGGKDYGRNIFFKRKKIYLWLCRVFLAVLRLSLVVENGAGAGLLSSCGARVSHCGEFFYCRTWSLVWAGLVVSGHAPWSAWAQQLWHMA